MNDTPLRHMLFLAVLLFVILSSGSLQCAMSCYDQAAGYSSGMALVADCHPLAQKALTQSPLSTLCHHGHSPIEVEKEPILQNIGALQFLALLTPRRETPAYHSAEPISHSYAGFPSKILARSEILPLSQNLKQLRSTILLI